MALQRNRTLIQDDIILLKHMQQGEEWAFNQLYLKYNSKVIYHVVNKGCSSANAPECCHDAFIRLYKTCRSSFFDDYQGSLEPWLKKVAYRTFLKGISKKGKTIEEIDELIVQVEDILSDLIKNEEYKGKRDLVIECLDRIGSRCKELIQLHIFGEIPANEIVELMNYNSVEVVYTSKNRCIENLKTRVQNLM